MQNLKANSLYPLHACVFRIYYIFLYICFATSEKLFEQVKNYAKNANCYDVTLNVWEGNDAAKHFYAQMGTLPKETQMEFILRTFLRALKTPYIRSIPLYFFHFAIEKILI